MQHWNGKTNMSCGAGVVRHRTVWESFVWLCIESILVWINQVFIVCIHTYIYIYVYTQLYSYIVREFSYYLKHWNDIYKCHLNDIFSFRPILIIFSLNSNSLGVLQCWQFKLHLLKKKLLLFFWSYLIMIVKHHRYIS